MLGKEVLKKSNQRSKKKSIYHMIFYNNYQKKEKLVHLILDDKKWIDAESPMILERNQKTVNKIIKQMGL